MRPLIDLAGLRFGRLFVNERGPNKGNRTRWHCTCDCGNERLVDAASLRNGKTTSCGCKRTEIAQAALKKRFGSYLGKITPQPELLELPGSEPSAD